MSATGNPWAQIPAEPPYVLAMDRAYVYAAQELQKSAGGALHLGRMPEPRSGPRDAPVVVLQLNPSYENQGSDQPLAPHDDKRLRAALHDEYSPHIGIADQHAWWIRAVKAPVEHFRASGMDEAAARHRVARGICSVEYFPYPSLQFACAHLRLPSQTYQFDLVREALGRGAIIVVTRGWSLWLGAVPELLAAHGTTVFRTVNPRRVALSQGNLPPGAYDKLLAALESVSAAQ